MRFLLDTHSFLWFIKDDLMLSDTAKALIESPENSLYLSIASLWEIAIKVSLGKLEVPLPLNDFIDTQLRINGIMLLEIKPLHIAGIVTLPFHHRDPFDRLIIATSQHENLPIIGKDEIFDTYAVDRFW